MKRYILNLTDDERADLVSAVRATERLQRLVDGLLDVARGQADRIVTDLEATTGARVAFLIRFGTGVLPEPKTVIQASDQVYVAAVSGRVAEAVAVAALPPPADLGEGGH